MINMTDLAVAMTLSHGDPYFEDKLIFNKTVPHFFNQTEHRNITLRAAAYAIRAQSGFLNGLNYNTLNVTSEDYRNFLMNTGNGMSAFLFRILIPLVDEFRNFEVIAETQEESIGSYYALIKISL